MCQFVLLASLLKIKFVVPVRSLAYNVQKHLQTVFHAKKTTISMTRQMQIKKTNVYKSVRISTFQKTLLRHASHVIKTVLPVLHLQTTVYHVSLTPSCRIISVSLNVQQKNLKMKLLKRVKTVSANVQPVQPYRCV